ncbi:transporter substrate-binding domain-containing protein [Puteibacter caeruleilacunae]|nr:transporter substrate-binding domain-containing protein [Puteibacter caeruleilacunae]
MQFKREISKGDYKMYVKMFLVRCLMFLSCFIMVASVKAEKLDYLTKEEQEWVQGHRNTIRIAQDPLYPPVNFVDKDGVYKGVTTDILKIIEHKLNVKFVNVPTTDLTESLNMGRKGEVDMVCSITKTPQRSRYLNFTRPYFRSPTVILLNGQESGRLTIDDLAERTVTMAENYAIHDYFRNYYPEIKLDLVVEDYIGMQKLAFNQADVMVGDLATISYHLEATGISNLYVAGQLDYEYRLAFGCRKDLPILQSILDKSLAQISPAELRRIKQKWVHLRPYKLWQRKEFWMVILGFLLLLSLGGLLSMIWSRTLQRRIDIKTNHLNRELQDRIIAEKSLEENERKLRVVVEKNGFIVFEKDIITGNIMWSGDYQNVLGFSSAEMNRINEPQWEQLIHSEDLPKYKSSVDTATKSGEEYVVECRVLDAHGEYVPITLKGTFLKEENDLEPRALGIIQDISVHVDREEELMNAKLRAERADHLKTLFLANMSHEIRTPLNGILGFSELISEEGINDDLRRNYARVITENSDHLLKIIGDILDISQIESGQMKIKSEDCVVYDVLSDVFNTFSGHPSVVEKKVRFSLVVNPDVKGIVSYTDPVRLKQVLINLVNNAFKFTPTGFIEVGFKYYSETEFLFFVKDSGIGIPPKKMDLIFERFNRGEDTMTRESDGAGLGLSISQGIIELLGGKIWLESEIDKGTEFFFTLPCCVKETV